MRRARTRKRTKRPLKRASDDELFEEDVGKERVEDREGEEEGG